MIDYWTTKKSTSRQMLVGQNTANLACTMEKFGVPAMHQLADTAL